jgi:hypothetical protein
MIVYRTLDDGGFVAGDTATERTSYAYPTSTYATMAKRHAERTAAEMMTSENIHRHGNGAPFGDHDARNWVRLNETRFA